MIKNFKNFRKRQNENGFTLIEMIVAMGVMAVVIPFMITMTVTSMQVKRNANSGTANILAAAAINSNLTEDIKTAAWTSVDPDNGNRVDIRQGQGGDTVCKTWWVEDGKLYKLYKGGEAITDDDMGPLVASDSPPIGENIKEIATGGYFKKNDSGLISYSLDLGDKDAAMTVSGSAEPRVMAGGPGDCSNE